MIVQQGEQSLAVGLGKPVYKHGVPPGAWNLIYDDYD